MLAKSIMKGGHILLLDEALNALPSKVEFDIFSKLKHEFKIIVSVTHNEHVQSIADYRLVMGKRV